MAPIFNDVTALAAVGAAGVRRPRAVAPASEATPLRRVLGTLHEPNTLTAGLLLATGIAVIARHPIARMIGTEVDTPAVGVSPATAPPAVVPAAHLPALSLPVPVATHSPVDPFRALVTQSGQVLAPSLGTRTTTGVATVTRTTTPAAVPVSATSTCAGTLHRVVGGDSLWTLAARAVHSSNPARVTVAWHRIYSANREVLGSNPGLIKVGESLCVPTRI